jgi:hypothetical protein
MASPDHNGTPKLRISKNEENAAVTRLLNERLERLPERNGEDVHKTFADIEFGSRLGDYARSSTLWRVAQVGIWLTIASLGLLGSVLAAVESGHIIAVAAGALVATLTTFAQAARPGLQADGYDNAQRAMRDEAWDFLNGTGDYADKTDEAQEFETFTERIRKIVIRKRSATQFQLE